MLFNGWHTQIAQILRVKILPNISQEYSLYKIKCIYNLNVKVNDFKVRLQEVTLKLLGQSQI